MDGGGEPARRRPNDARLDRHRDGSTEGPFRRLLQRVLLELSLDSLDDQRKGDGASRTDGPRRSGTASSHPSLAWLAWLAWLGPLPGRRPDREWFRPSSWKDIALASFLCCGTLVVMLLPPPQTVTVAGAVAFVAALTPMVLLAWRPRLCEWLLAVALVCWVAAVAVGASGSELPAIVAIYTIGTHRTWRRTMVAVLTTDGVASLVGLGRGPDLAWPAILAALVAQTVGYFAIAAIGLYMGTRRAYVRTLIERTQDLERERELLERERDLMTQRAVAVERARIARELHDVVAHHVSVMVIQAGAAQASLPAGADAAGQAIEAIRETGREAMTEMRRLLGLLRSEESLGPEVAAGDATDVGTRATRSPLPGMTDLEALVGRTREAGVDVTLEVVGVPRHIPPGVELSAYRVAQEALTNTLRHAGPGSTARLRLSFEPEVLSVEVIDDGRGRPTVESVERPRNDVGHGLVGMRERVALFGGRLEVGPAPGGGYRVLASFPLDEGSENVGDLPVPTSASVRPSSEVRP